MTDENLMRMQFEQIVIIYNKSSLTAKNDSITVISLAQTVMRKLVVMQIFSCHSNNALWDLISELLCTHCPKMDVEDEDKMEDNNKGGRWGEKTSACRNGFITMGIIYCEWKKIIYTYKLFICTPPPPTQKKNYISHF